ncbi:MAG: preprotein translocase subunit SecA [Firmicutes bacterium]|nr:preprotein translocase subunit SecA [Bacillota bacterium]
MLGFLRNLFDNNDKEIRRLAETVEVINSWEPEIEKLTDAQLQAKTAEFKQRLADGQSLDEILPEAFAVVREASRRTLKMRHFDVQLMGGIVLHEGKIAEMKTGEGKTLAATLPVYLNALTGKGVHVVTVNDYLARRDAEWMGQIYKFLGLSVGVILHDLDFAQRREAYNCDVAYGTNNEFGFDYLRDNMVFNAEEMVQRDMNYAIVDEVDSILIDEARTPLIISGQAEESTDLYYRFARLVPRLQKEKDYTVDEKAHTVAINEEGVAKVEKMLGVENLYDESHIELTHHLNQALKAHALMKRDRDYVVKDGQVIIVDEFTGRLMFGRRYSDGLHQAIEAKEGVKIEKESQTLATITFQNYFRMYEKLAGMTGTAKTEENEFYKIYGLEVVVIPTNQPMIRKDFPDVVFKTERAKFKAVADEIEDWYRKGRPVLVGTISIEKSELLSDMLKKRGVPHQVLNAKYHEKEAEIIAQAGQRNTVTIATNMAGRGTDIVLGEGVVDLGGLHIIGTERHESRRIDNQLRGRSGRQGDPGSSRFYVSLEDDLMRLFGSQRIMGIMDRLGWQEDQPIEHNQIARAIENAQKKVEAHHFDIRKHVLEYDDVMNQQREVIYAQRRKLLRGETVQKNILEMVIKVLEEALETYASEKVYPEDWDLEALSEHVNQVLALRDRDLVKPEDLDIRDRAELKARLADLATQTYSRREAEIGGEQMRTIERIILLRTIDGKWMDHLKDMDDLREGIGLRAYGQREPLLEYKFEAFEMFKAMTDSIQEDVVRYIFRVQLISEEEEAQQHRLRNIRTNRDASGTVDGTRTPVRTGPKVGRNDPCPCGSGKKYKKCCGAN